jgi:hypothetical protein
MLNHEWSVSLPPPFLWPSVTFFVRRLWVCVCVCFGVFVSLCVSVCVRVCGGGVCVFECACARASVSCVVLSSSPKELWFDFRCNNLHFFLAQTPGGKFSTVAISDTGWPLRLYSIFTCMSERLVSTI